VPEFAHQVRLDWTGNVVGYVSSVPEASAWTMMIIGFAGIASLTYRRKNSGALSPHAKIGGNKLVRTRAGSASYKHQLSKIT
jgi:hypothetical protein